MEQERTRHRVVIVGGGFGGLYAAKQLGIDPEIAVTLVDRRNFEGHPRRRDLAPDGSVLLVRMPFRRIDLAGVGAVISRRTEASFWCVCHSAA